jgi:outer membrane protease
VSAHDADNHHLTGFLFKDKFGSDNQMASVNLQLGYAVAPNISFTLGYDCEKFFTAKGSTTGYDTWFPDEPILVFSGDAAGANSEAHTVSVGVKAKF